MCIHTYKFSSISACTHVYFMYKTYKHALKYKISSFTCYTCINLFMHAFAHLYIHWWMHVHMYISYIKHSITYKNSSFTCYICVYMHILHAYIHHMHPCMLVSTLTLLPCMDICIALHMHCIASIHELSMHVCITNNTQLKSFLSLTWFEMISGRSFRKRLAGPQDHRCCW